MYLPAVGLYGSGLRVSIMMIWQSQQGEPRCGRPSMYLPAIGLDGLGFRVGSMLEGSRSKAADLRWAAHAPACISVPRDTPSKASGCAEQTASTSRQSPWCCSGSAPQVASQPRSGQAHAWVNRHPHSLRGPFLPYLPGLCWARLGALCSACSTVDQMQKHHRCIGRRVIAAAVAGDPKTYSEALLGRPNAEYCRWILDKDNWGGAIELSILSRRARSPKCGLSFACPGGHGGS